MPYPVIPLVGYWNNSIQYTPKFTRLEFGKGGVIQRRRSQILNQVSTSYSVNAVVTDRDSLHNFLRGREGKPFEYRTDGETPGKNYTCTNWEFTWQVWTNASGVASGVWNFNATFTEDLNPVTE